MLEDTPPTQLTLQKIGVQVAFKAGYKTLSFNFNTRVLKAVA